MGSRFKKGKSGNPSGRPPNSIHISEMRAIARGLSLSGTKAIVRLWQSTPEQLKEIVKNPESTMFDVNLATIMLKAAKTGDHRAWSELYSWVVGKPSIDINALAGGEEEKDAVLTVTDLVRKLHEKNDI